MYRFIIHSNFTPTQMDTKFGSVYIVRLKNQTNSYDFLRIKRVRALLLSVSFKPIFIDFTLLIDMLPLLQFSIAIVVCG